MKVGRNDPCPCGSGKKYKKCCLAKDEAAERQAARERAATIQAASELLTPAKAELPPVPDPLPELTFPDEPLPLSPEEEAYQLLWEEFEAAETDELPALFRRALAEGLLEDELAFELLSSLRGQGELASAAALIDELRAARPDLYTANAPYYLDWQVEDALAAGRGEVLAALAGLPAVARADHGGAAGGGAGRSPQAGRYRGTALGEARRRSGRRREHQGGLGACQALAMEGCGAASPTAGSSPAVSRLCTGGSRSRAGKLPGSCRPPGPPPPQNVTPHPYTGVV